LPHSSGSRITEGEIRFQTILPLKILNSGLPKEATPKGDGVLMFRRKAQPKGPLVAFGYDYFSEHAKAVGIATPKLLNYEGLWGAGQEYAYEVLNFADGRGNAEEIRDADAAEYGPLPLAMALE